MELSFIKYYLATLIGYLLNYFIGHLLCSLFLSKSNDEIYEILKKNLIGFASILFFYSIIKTQLHTINIGWIIIASVLFIKKKTQLNRYSFTKNFTQIEYRYIYWQLFILSVIYIHSFFLCKSFFTNDYFLPFANIYKDPYYYSIVAHNLAKFGIENNCIDDTKMLLQSNVSLYHYGELWFTAFFNQLFKLKSLYVFSLITYSTYSTYTVIASVVLIKLLFKKINTYTLLLSPIILVIGGISFFYPIFSFMDTTNVDIGLFCSPKYSMLGIFILLQFIFILKEDYILFVLAVLSTLLINTSLIVPLGISVGLFLMLLILSKKITFFQLFEMIVIAFIFLVSTLGLIFFYNTKAISVSDNIKVDYFAILSLKKLFFLMKFCVAYGIKFFLSLIVPIIILCVYKFFKKNGFSVRNNKWTLFLYIFLLLSSAIFSSGIFLEMPDSFQFRINIYTVVSSIIVYIIIQYFILEKNRIALFFAFILITLVIYQTKPYNRIPSVVDKKFIHNVLKSYKGEKVARFISNDNIYMNKIVYFPMEYMFHYTDYFYPICVNVFDGKATNDKYILKTNNILLPLTSFYIYYTKSKKTDSTLSLVSIENNFINQYNFKYLVYEKNSIIPNEIRNRIKTTYVNSLDSIYFSVLR